ncbi:MAG TPA: exosortase/archaeosortase family protein [Dissulfurispiraceae bacterium]
MKRNTLLFLSYTIAVLAAFHAPLRELLELSLRNDSCSYILFIPLFSGGIMFSRRAQLARRMSPSYMTGIAAALMGGVLRLLCAFGGTGLGHDGNLPLMMVSLVMFLAGGFIFLYGARAFRSVLFPFLLLLLMVPVPAGIMGDIVRFLQTSSADVSYFFFKLVRIPVEREGFIFHLPGVNIEVAQQCSGIRSSTVLFIMGVLASGLFLRTGWRRAVLILSILPIAIVKNGIRITTLSFLAVYVDKDILESSLHRKGGIIFFIIAMGIFASVLKALEKSEANQRRERAES